MLSEPIHPGNLEGMWICNVWLWVAGSDVNGLTPPNSHGLLKDLSMDSTIIN